jgi:uncharacterized protein YcgL (UPF0745 family)
MLRNLRGRPDVAATLREEVRTALNRYASYLELAADPDDADAQHDALVSLTQIASAKRVLWMED